MTEGASTAVGHEPVRQINERRQPLPTAASVARVAVSCRPGWLMRAFDVVFAASVLLMTAPLLAVAIVAIRLESPGPALFRQRRMGRDGRIFSLVKLRGMYVDAHLRFPDLYGYQQYSVEHADAFYFHCTPNDPRVTRVGKLLRKLSVDELPNFWNVLRGEMAVVGPRPEIPELAHMYGDSLPRILSVRPGVTSPAKASGRDTLSLQDTIALDLTYVENRSWRLDLLTIGRTAVSVARRRGVN